MHEAEIETGYPHLCVRAFLLVRAVQTPAKPSPSKEDIFSVCGAIS